MRFLVYVTYRLYIRIFEYVLQAAKIGLMVFKQNLFLNLVLNLLQRVTILLVTFALAFSFSVGMNVSNTLLKSNTHGAPHSVLSGGTHSAASCNTATTTVRSGRLERLKKVIKRFSSAFFPITPPQLAELFPAVKLRSYAQLKNHVLKVFSPPGYRLFACYIS